MLANDTAHVNIVDGELVRQWVDLVHGDSTGLIHISSTLNWAGATFDEAHRHLIPAHVQALHDRGAEGIYMRATTLGRPLGPEERGAEADSHELPGLWADIDIAGPGHKTAKPLPVNEQQAMMVVAESGLPDPTLWVHSGGGLYPWWLFDRPALVTDATVVALREMSAGLQKVLGHTADRLGFFYGTQCGDLPRVLRVPGSVNRKKGTPHRLCQLYPTQTDGTVYQVDQMMAHVRGLVEALPVPEPPRPPAQAPVGGLGLTPGDDFENRTDWADPELLGGAGWRFHHQQGRTRYWERPGGSSTGGHSASTGRDPDRDRLYVFSDATDFIPEQPYTKFAAYALLHHGGSYSRAASHLRSKGYGDQRPMPAPLPLPPVPAGANGHSPADAPADSPEDPAPVPMTPVVAAGDGHPLSDVGNGSRMADMHGEKFRWCLEEKQWYHWEDGMWRPDKSLHIQRAAEAMTFALVAHANAVGATDGKRGDKLYKFAMASQSDAKVNAAISRFKSQPGVSVSADGFNPHRHLVTVANGTLDLRSGGLVPHDPRHMGTRMFGAAYDPAATCPQFEKFLEEVLPDPQVREYLQRAVAYTLTGDADERAMFLLHGPSGTGKTQFTELMTTLFGDYAGTAASSTFRAKHSEATFDLHQLRGKRFVATSETSADLTVDEALVKRITGMDSITSRTLFQAHVSWKPECAVWVATNHLPRLTSDDNAVWARVKPIAFTTQFSRDGSTGHKEVKNIAHTVLAKEAAGILNWVLAGLKAYRERGLEQPEVVTEAVRQYQLESDVVAQFMSESVEDGLLVVAEPTDSIGSTHLWEIFTAWSQRNRAVPLGQRRFTNRLRALGYQDYKHGTKRWRGVRAGSGGLLGTMG